MCTRAGDTAAAAADGPDNISPFDPDQTRSPHLALTRTLTSVPGFCDLRNPRRTTLGRKVG
jgi:hypothetical protein